MKKLFLALFATSLLILSACAAEAAELPAPEPTPTVISLALAGDMVMHMPINDDAAQPDGSYDYAPLFEDIKPYIEGADLALCNIEFVFPGTEYLMGFPFFWTPEDMAYELKDAGFDLINTATNHSPDGRLQGIVHTLDVLDDAGLRHVGTFRTPEEREEGSGITVMDVKGVTIAFLSYAYSSNAIPIDGYEYAMNIFFKDFMGSQLDIDYDLLKSDMAAARALGTDVIAVSMHWGAEYTTEPNEMQRSLADFLFAEGADLVIGGHPHVPEPMELRTVTAADGSERTGFLCYCLGNLVANQERDYTDLSALVQLELTKYPDTGETVITGADYIPLTILDTNDCGVYDAPRRFYIWDTERAVSDYEAGDDRDGIINEYMYQRFKKDILDLEAICGELTFPEK